MKATILRRGWKVSGVEVLHLLNLSERRYAVRYGCCGADGELTHKQIDERRRNGATRCYACGQRARFLKGAAA